MERHVLILQFRKCKIHSGRQPEGEDTDFSESGQSMPFTGGVREVKPEALQGRPLLYGATLGGAEPGAQEHQ